MIEGDASLRDRSPKHLKVILDSMMLAEIGFPKYDLVSCHSVLPAWYIAFSVVEAPLDTSIRLLL